MTLKRGKRVRLLIAIALILTSVGGVIGGIWLSIQLFINPDATSVKQLLPWAQSVNPDYAQLPQIKTSIQQLGQIPGEALPLEGDNSLERVLLLPVLNQRPNCQNNCEQIVELRLYQQVIVSNLKETYYQQIDQIPITGLDRASVISWLVEAGVANSDSDDSPLPLTELHRFIGNTPKQGIWLYLLGKMQGTSAIAYGYILHYNPKTSELNLLLPWSTTGVVPEWQQITGSASPELVINQTVDLEPQLSVYQVKSSDFNTIELSEISLIKPALKNSAYQDALFLAQNGLWSPAWKWLQFIKQHNQDWSTASQAQMDLIRLYAVFTQAQADRIWASPSQQVLADLIDGRWASALQVFQASVENTQDTEEIIALLTDEQLWNRVEAALQVNPNRPEVQAWKELILAARSGEGLQGLQGLGKGQGGEGERGSNEQLIIDNCFLSPSH